MLIVRPADVNHLSVEYAEDLNRFSPYRSMCRRVRLFRNDFSATAGQVKCDQELEVDLTRLRPAQGVFPYD